MNELTREIEGSVDAILDALDRDESVDSMFLGPITPEVARGALPGRERRAWAVPLAPRWAGYLFVRAEPSPSTMTLVRFFERGGRWLAEGSPISSPVTEQDREEVLSGLIDMGVSMSTQEPSRDRHAWPPMPAVTPLDRIRVVSRQAITI